MFQIRSIGGWCLNRPTLPPCLPLLLFQVGTDPALLSLIHEALSITRDGYSLYNDKLHKKIHEIYNQHGRTGIEKLMECQLHDELVIFPAVVAHITAEHLIDTFQRVDEVGGIAKMGKKRYSIQGTACGHLCGNPLLTWMFGLSIRIFTGTRGQNDEAKRIINEEGGVADQIINLVNGIYGESAQVQAYYILLQEDTHKDHQDRSPYQRRIISRMSLSGEGGSGDDSGGGTPHYAGVLRFSIAKTIVKLIPELKGIYKEVHLYHGDIYELSHVLGKVGYSFLDHSVSTSFFGWQHVVSLSVRPFGYATSLLDMHGDKTSTGSLHSWCPCIQFYHGGQSKRPHESVDRGSQQPSASFLSRLPQGSDCQRAIQSEGVGGPQEPHCSIPTAWGLNQR